MKTVNDADFSNLLKDAVTPTDTQSDNPYYAGDVLSIPTDKVQPRPQQVRAQLNDIDELAESIKESTQQQPIVVDPMNADGIHFIQKGQRRWAACQRAGVNVLAMVRDPEAGVKKIVGQLVENIQRDDLTPFEIGASLNAIVKDSGVKQKDIAQMIGKDRRYVGRHLRIVNAPSEIVERCQEASLADSVLIDEFIKLHTLNPKVALKLLNKGASRADVIKAVKTQQGIKTPRSKKTPLKPVIGHNQQACRILKRGDNETVLIEYRASKKHVSVALNALRIIQC